MTYVKKLAMRVGMDEKGASLLEYSILIGIITVAAIFSIGEAGKWVGAAWTKLVGLLP